MRFCVRSALLSCLLAWTCVSLPILADPADVEGSHDYPGWARMPGFEITDYDEDNPAEYTFSVSRPLPIDAAHLEGVPVEGHRYVIHYQWAGSGAPPSLLQSQRYYEKMAIAAGYTVEKNGAVGNVTETFHLKKDGRQVWVYLNPAIRINILTIMESRGESSGSLTITAPSSTPEIKSPEAAIPPPVSASIPKPAVATGPAPAPEEDPLAVALLKDGEVVLPVTFLPGKADLDANSQPMIDRVVAILKLHPDMLLTIEGHTDLTGDEQANLTLSRLRAQTVRGLLIDGHIRSKRLVATGVGGSQPIADENTAEGREKNRRIELIVRTASATTPSPTPPAAKTPATPKQVTRSAPNPPAVPETEPVVETPSQFHPAAPDGVNYYPGTSSSADTAKPATTHSKVSR